MIKKTLITNLHDILFDIVSELYNIQSKKYVVEKNKDINNGEIYTNIAMTLAKDIKKNPIDIALEISNKIKSKFNLMFEKVDVVKPGYINFYLSKKMKTDYLNYVLFMGENYGFFHKKDILYNIEFVSANPTGYLHIGHARNAALGMTLSNILKYYGIDVENEYYINDAGNQINILGVSVFLRYLELHNISVNMDGDFYKGSEIIEIAKLIKDSYGDAFVNNTYDNQSIHNEEVFNIFKDFSLNKMLSFIKEDLNELRIIFDRFFSERSIYERNLIEKILNKLKDYIYESEGAIWLRTSSFGDDKDRVLIKNNGDYTYFLPDIAYHYEKISRNSKTKKIINIWGADHKSYVDRMNIAIKCLGYENIMDVLIMQMVRLTKDGQEYKMSKRTGNSLTLKDLIQTIGVDGSRWALVSQTSDTQIEIDIDKFKSKTYDNQLYYVLYAYARISQILNKIEVEKEKFETLIELENLKEKELINTIIYFPHIIESISKNYEVNKLINYINSLAQTFHSYYNDVKIIDDTSEKNMQLQRILLLKAIQFTLFSALKLLNITPKEKI